MSKPGISATVVKNWFQYRCDRKTRYETMPRSELDAIPVEKKDSKAAWSLEGDRYEELVLQRLGQNVLRPTSTKDPLSEQLSTAFIAGKRSEQYASQINLRPTTAPDFVSGTGYDIRRTMVDLVQRQVLDGTSVFTLIDIKATRHATAFHKAQVAFYALLLEHMLAEKKIPGKVSEEGQIWRIPDKGLASSGEYHPEPFRLEPYVRMVRDLCQNRLTEIAKADVNPSKDETFFHVYFKCEQCDFLPHCQRSIERPNPAQNDVSSVAGLSHESKRALNRFGISTVGQLAEAPGVGNRDGIGWSLQRSAPLLVKRAQAIVDNKILRTEQAETFLMPPSADAALFISVDYDPVDDMIAAIGYHYNQGSTARRKVIIVDKSDRNSEADALIEVLSLLISDLNKIDAHNQQAEEEGSSQIRAHIFCYEPTEARNLQSAVGRHIDDDRIRNGLLHVVRLFPPDDVVPEPEYRGAHHLPATSVRSVIEQLYAIPVTVSHDLRQVSNALAAAGAIKNPYVPTEPFERAFSSLLSIDVIRWLKEGRKDAPTVADIEKDVNNRLDALIEMVDWLFEEDERAREDGSAMLRLQKRPFQFHASFDPLNVADLDVLRALELLESRAGLLEALVALAQPARQRRDRGRCMANMELLRSTPRNWGAHELVFRVPLESRDCDIQPGAFGLILTDDDPDMRLDRFAWCDCAVRFMPPYSNDGDDIIRLSIKSNVFKASPFQAMYNRSQEKSVWCLDQTFTDINNDRAARFISSLIDESIA